MDFLRPLPFPLSLVNRLLVRAAARNPDIAVLVDRSRQRAEHAAGAAAGRQDRWRRARALHARTRAAVAATGGAARIEATIDAADRDGIEAHLLAGFRLDGAPAAGRARLFATPSTVERAPARWLFGEA